MSGVKNPAHAPARAAGPPRRRKWLLACIGLLFLGAVAPACWWLFSLRNPVAVVEHEDGALALAFSPDGKYLAAGCRNAWKGRLIVWEVGSYKQRLNLPQEQWANAVAFSPDGKLLAVALGRYNDTGKDDFDGYRDAPGEVRVYDAATGKLKETLEHKLAVYALAFSPDGKLLATAGGEPLRNLEDEPSDAVAFLWDTQTWRKKASLKGLRDRVPALAFSADGKTLAVADGAYDDEDERKHPSKRRGVVRLYEPPAEKPKGKLLAQPFRVRWLAFLADGSLLVWSGVDGELALWDPKKGARKDEEAPYRGRYDANGAVCLSPDRKTLAIATGGPVDHPRPAPVSVWDLASGKEVLSWKEDRPGIGALAISPDGKLLATGGKVKVWALPRR
jgi:WD40 repeat protein